MVLRNLLLVPWMWCRLCYHAAHPDKYSLEEHFKMLRFVVQRANKGGNVIVESYGAENLPEQDGFVLYPNHQGLYDVLAIAGACSRTFTVVAKKEVEHIPFLKQVFACIHALFMDRENLRQSMQVINEAADVVKEGKNVILFPEGTSSRKGNQLLEFKSCFVPFDSNTVRPVTVEVHFLDPIPYEEYQGMKTTEIAEMVKKRIEAVVTA